MLDASASRWKVNRRDVAKHGVLIALCLWVLLPLVWVFLRSLKTGKDTVTRNIWPTEFPDPLWARYRWIWTDFNLENEFWRGLVNGLTVTSITVALAVITACLGGYALVHLATPEAFHPRIDRGINVLSNAGDGDRGIVENPV
ncbi:hypothetical protein BH23CHL5_BH23CHL5_26070 [soil metagenome]